MKKNTVKKNVMMRTAGGLLIATLLTTSLVSGTFAKYVTQDANNDSARVAKFGVLVEAKGTLFANTYIKTTNTPGTGGENETLTVNSNNNGAVVAPGTKSDTNGLTINVKGTPEVTVDVAFTFGDNASDVWLGKGTYPDMTNGDVYDEEYTAGDVFTLSSAYYPIKYTLTQTTTTSGKEQTPTELVKGGNLEAVIKALEGLNKTYDPNTDLSEKIGTLTLTWEWAFTDATDDNIDKADTLLGNLAAGRDGVLAAIKDVNKAVTAYNATESATVATLETVPETAKKTIGAVDQAYNLNTCMDLTVSVTQVD